MAVGLQLGYGLSGVGELYRRSAPPLKGRPQRLLPPLLACMAAQDGTWAGHIELQAASAALQVPRLRDGGARARPFTPALTCPVLAGLFGCMTCLLRAPHPIPLSPEQANLCIYQAGQPCSRIHLDGVSEPQESPCALSCPSVLHCPIFWPTAHHPQTTNSVELQPAAQPGAPMCQMSSHPPLLQGVPTLHISYHDGMHFNSVRMAGDYSNAPPQVSAAHAVHAVQSSLLVFCCCPVALLSAPPISPRYLTFHPPAPLLML